MKKVSRFVYWTPRIVSMIFILFLALFSLDIFGMGYGFWEILLGLFVHNIPSLILTLVLIFAWKREIVGAITFFIAGIAYIFLILYRNNFEWYMLSWSLIIAGPAFLIAFLFWLGWKKKIK